MEIKIGDQVFHHGALHVVQAVSQKGTIKDGVPVAVHVVTFANSRYTVTAKAEDFVKDAELGCWVLPGRVLARNERALAEAVLGSWPKASGHQALLAAVDRIDLDAVDVDTFAGVLKRRKADAVNNPREYAKAALDQIKQIRQTREELKNA